ncbi:MAG: glycine cleavage system protein GcvH [Acidimicrobiia bacterium]|nr:glycine cleavage system protein GcvH [Acidimicrobiia bacterium]
MNVPNDLLYTEEHEWLAVDGTTVRLGITDFAQDQLGDIVYVDLPDVGAELEKDDTFAEVESTKSVGEVYAPFDGVVTAVNDALVDTPELVNSDPYGEGWLIEMTVATEIGDLLDANAYRALTE